MENPNWACSYLVSMDRNKLHLHRRESLSYKYGINHFSDNLTGKAKGEKNEYFSISDSKWTQISLSSGQNEIQRKTEPQFHTGFWIFGVHSFVGKGKSRLSPSPI